MRHALHVKPKMSSVVLKVRAMPKVKAKPKVKGMPKLRHHCSSEEPTYKKGCEEHVCIFPMLCHMAPIAKGHGCCQGIVGCTPTNVPPWEIPI